MTKDKNIFEKEFSRRKFLKASGLTAASLAILSGCATDKKNYLARNARELPNEYEERHAFANYNYQPINETKVPTACYMCAINCEAVAVLDEDGIVKRMEPNPGTPVSAGALCAKGNAGVEQLYDEERLKTPMQKVGDYDWKEITWDEAFDIMYDKFTAIAESYGPETVVALNRRGYHGSYLRAWLRAYGSPNGPFGQESICDGGKRVAQQLVVGHRGLQCDYRNSKYIMLLGANQFESPRYRLGMIEDILYAQENGAKLVVVDPRFNYTAAKADEFVPIEAGTDLMFLNSMAHVINREGLVDQGFIDTYGNGYDDFIAEVSQDKYAPENASQICGIPAEDIERLAIEFAQAETAVADTSSGIVMSTNGTQADWALLNLVAMTGNMLSEGGVLRKAGVKRETRSFEENNVAEGVKAYHEVLGYPSYEGNPEGGNRNILPECILTPEAVPAGPISDEETISLYNGNGIKSLIVYNTDPVGAQGNKNKIIEAFNNLDFGVVVDIYLNQTAEAMPVGSLALPEATYLERYATRSGNGYTPNLILSQPAIEPLWESKSALWIFTKLGQRFGFSEFMDIDLGEDGLGLEETRAEILDVDQGDGLTIDWDELTQTGVWMKTDTEDRNYKNYEKVFNNEKYYFAFTGDNLNEDHEEYLRTGARPTPTYESYHQKSEDYPLRFMAGGKVLWHTQTSTRNNKYLMQIFDENVIVKDTNYIVMSPQDAADRGLETGSLANVSSPTGNIEGEVLVSERLPIGYVHMTHGFGHIAPSTTLANGVGYDPNILLDNQRVDPQSSCFTAKEEICQVTNV